MLELQDLTSAAFILGRGAWGEVPGRTEHGKACLFLQDFFVSSQALLLALEQDRAIHGVER